MGILERIKRLFQASGDQDAHWVHVRCNQCGEALRTRVDLAHDLTTQYDSNGHVEGYFARKMIIGSDRCFNQIEVEMEFDRSRQPLSHEVQGGELISREEFQQAQLTQEDGENLTADQE
ncbi:MAG: hypothetical protein ACLFWD_02705 [Anaerolineales bacterium]